MMWVVENSDRKPILDKVIPKKVFELKREG